MASLSPEQFSALAELLPEAMLLVSAGGEIRAANGAAAKLLSYDPGDLIGRSLVALATGSAGVVERYLRECARSRQLLPSAFPLLSSQGEPIQIRLDGGVVEPPRPDGEAVVLLRLRPKEQAVGRFTLLNDRISELAREVTRRQRAERDLDEQRGWLQVVLASIADGVLATDIEGRVLLMNAVAEKLTGWRLEEAVGEPLEKVFCTVNEVSRKPLPSPVERVLREGSAVSDQALLVSRGGVEVAIEDHAAPIRDASGEVLGVVVSFRDASERRRIESERAEVLVRERAARAKAEAADRDKDEFLATLSHELRAPLHAIASWTYLLRTGGLDEETTARALATIERNVKLQSRLVDDLLDTSHLIAGQVEIEQKPVRLLSVVRAACDDLGPTIEDKGVRLETLLDPAAGVVTGDAERLRQVITNLLSNAYKFTPEGGRIEVRLEPGVDSARIVVTDSGEGIPAEAIGQIFDRFRQADSSRTRSHGGLGLGLAIARQLTELHGGTIAAESAGSGRGASFTVVLPTATAKSEPSPPEAEKPANLAGVLALLVEDEPDAREVVRAVLQRLGAAVMTAGSAGEASEAIAEVVPDVLICDVALPGADGDTLLESLRRYLQVEGRRLPAIALTGLARADDRERTRVAGFDRHLTKPVDPDVLAKAVAELVRRPSPEDPAAEDDAIQVGSSG